MTARLWIRWASLTYPRPSGDIISFSMFSTQKILNKLGIKESHICSALLLAEGGAAKLSLYWNSCTDRSTGTSKRNQILDKVNASEYRRHKPRGTVSALWSEGFGPRNTYAPTLNPARWAKAMEMLTKAFVERTMGFILEDPKTLFSLSSRLSPPQLLNSSGLDGTWK